MSLLVPKTPLNVYMRMINSYLIFTSEKGANCIPNQAPVSQLKGGMKCKKVGSLKRRCLTYIPPTTHQKTWLEDKGCQQHASQNEMLPHDQEDSHVCFEKGPCVNQVNGASEHSPVSCYFSNKGTPLVKSQSNLNKFFICCNKIKYLPSSFHPLSPFSVSVRAVR